jgi:hypothetical protein
MARSGSQRRRRVPPKSPPEEADLAERKEKVLHTRVPESLDRHIRSRARGLGLSVSTVVRNVLLNTFGLVEDIVTDSTNIALAIAGESAVERGEVVAWQEAVLNVNAVCDHCNAVLRKGARAAIGLRPEPGPREIICPRCLARVGEPRRAAVRRERRKPS